MSGGKVAVKVQGRGTLSFLNLSKEYDLCSVIPTSCPIKAGSTTISIRREIPNAPVVSAFDVGSANNQFVCLLVCLLVCLFACLLFWTGLRRECPLLRNPENGMVKFTEGRAVGAKVWYICNEGFVLVGSETRTCQSDLTWAPKAPTCKRNLFVCLFVACLFV